VAIRNSGARRTASSWANPGPRIPTVTRTSRIAIWSRPIPAERRRERRAPQPQLAYDPFHRPIPGPAAFTPASSIPRTRPRASWRGAAGWWKARAGRKRLTASIGDRTELGNLVKMNAWNQYAVVGRGGTVIHIVNRQLMALTVDDDPESSNNRPGAFGNPTLKPRRFNADEPICPLLRFGTLGGKTCPHRPLACACIEPIVTPTRIARAETTMLFLGGRNPNAERGRPRGGECHTFGAAESASGEPDAGALHCIPGIAEGLEAARRDAGQRSARNTGISCPRRESTPPDKYCMSYG
jgi:hypothetical protein